MVSYYQGQEDNISCCQIEMPSTFYSLGTYMETDVLASMLVLKHLGEGDYRKGEQASFKY